MSGPEEKIITAVAMLLLPIVMIIQSVKIYKLEQAIDRHDSPATQPELPRPRLAGDDRHPQPTPRVWEWVEERFEVTAYCPCERCCGEHADGITASGQRVDGPIRYWVAADKRFPFGTVFLIPGYGDGPVCVLDRGGAIKGNRLDVFFGNPELTVEQNHQEALKWGRRILAVKILK